AFPNCGADWQQVSWNPNGNSTQATWIQNVGNFFQDVREKLRPSPLPYPNVVITFNFDPGGAAAMSLPKSDPSIVPPLGDHCADTPDPVYFYPLFPVGVKLGGSEIGFGD